MDTPNVTAQYIMGLNTKIPVGLRGDCLGLNSDGNGGFYEHFRDYSNKPQWPTMENRWQTAPYLVEYCGGYSPTDTEASGLTGTQAAQGQVRDYHVASVGNGNLYSSIPNPPYNAWLALTPSELNDAQMVGELAGYRYALNAVSIQDPVVPGITFQITSNWQNVGSSPAYFDWKVYYLIRNQTNNNTLGQLVSNISSNVNLRRFYSNASGINSVIDEVTIPKGSVSSGMYNLYLRIDDPIYYYPPLRLFITTSNQTDGSYLLGTIAISQTLEQVELFGK